MDFARAFPSATTLPVPRELLADIRDEQVAALRAGDIDEAAYESDMRAARLAAYRDCAGDRGRFEFPREPAG